jgi:hypothetical protein
MPGSMALLSTLEVDAWKGHAINVNTVQW